MRTAMPAPNPGDVARPAPVPTPSPDEWSRVHLERLHVERASPPSTLAKVRVCVDMGCLLPVDIDAELEIEGGPDASLPDVARERMWSAHPYGNGRFDFETDVPDATLLQSRRLRVRVRPAAARHEPAAAEMRVPTLTLDLTTATPAR